MFVVFAVLRSSAVVFLDLSVGQSVGPFFGAALVASIEHGPQCSRRSLVEHRALRRSRAPYMCTVLVALMAPLMSPNQANFWGLGPCNFVEPSPCFISGGSDPETSNSHFFGGAAASQTYRPMPMAFAYQTPSSPFLEGRLPDRPLCLMSSATRPSLGWGWVGVDFCFGGRRADKAHYKS